MKTNYILVDYENIQVQNIALLNREPFHVLVFVGANQTKIPFELAITMQQLGERGTYIKIEGSGRNALDFHIAFYIGQLSERDPNSFFHVISSDTGFDPLLSHLKNKKILVQRHTDIINFPFFKTQNNQTVKVSTSTTSATKSTTEKIDIIIKDLGKRGKSRPRKIQTLQNTINSLFMKKLKDEEIAKLIEQLTQQGYLTISQQGQVSYSVFK